MSKKQLLVLFRSYRCLQIRKSWLIHSSDRVSPKNRRTLALSIQHGVLGGRCERPTSPSVSLMHPTRLEALSPSSFLAMSTLLLSILSLSTALHCPAWKEIAPCTCRTDSNKLTTIACDKMGSFRQILDLLQGHFEPQDRVSLRLAASNLRDLRDHSFKELNVSIENLNLNHNYYGIINGDSFDGLDRVTYLSLSDTVLEEVPQVLWHKMPNVKTVDLGRAKIRELTESSFRDIPLVECLVLPGNHISRMEKGSIPSHVQRLHLGRNRLVHLNDTLRHLSELTWFFVNANELTSLEGQLPRHAPNLQLVHAANNKIDRLPKQLKTFPALESLFFQYNLLTSLDNVLSRSRQLKRVVLEYNYINRIAKDEFEELEMLESLLLGHNEITSLNNSLLNLRSLNFLNMTYNYLTEFSFQDIVGLQELRSIDLSFNQISKLVGPATNLVEWNIKLTELKLDHNHLESLDGALSGLPELLRLNLSFNRLRKIAPDDFIGLDQLRLLDISHNFITTLEETSKTFLPRLSELKASHNLLTVLEKDFHGLPVLCHADLSDNRIVALGRDLVTKTRCKIEHGVHEGSWDTLKIYLQDNPILCDAALPEIMSAMEINHTRIYGVSHCPPLSEQPVTPRLNAFLGYVPDATSRPTIAALTSFDPKPHTDVQLLEPPNHIPAFAAVRYQQLETDTTTTTTTTTSPNVTSSATSNANSGVLPMTVANDQEPTTNRRHNRTILLDPVLQGEQLTKLASQIEELRTRVDQLSTQNQILINATLQERKEDSRKP